MCYYMKVPVISYSFQLICSCTVFNISNGRYTIKTKTILTINYQFGNQTITGENFE